MRLKLIFIYISKENFSAAVQLLFLFLCILLPFFPVLFRFFRFFLFSFFFFCIVFYFASCVQLWQTWSRHLTHSILPTDPCFAYGSVARSRLVHVFPVYGIAIRLLNTNRPANRPAVPAPKTVDRPSWQSLDLPIKDIWDRTAGLLLLPPPFRLVCTYILRRARFNKLFINTKYWIWVSIYLK